MHSVEELGAHVPAFLAKLWKIVEDPETNDLICWCPGGTSFVIRNQARFARELLPLYYKHNNMASFVRQLNMYGFHKVVSIEGGGLKLDKDEMEFAHQYFLMGHPYLLEHIKRKISTSKVEEGRPGAKPELVNKVLAEVKSMKGRQDSVDTQLSAMKRENEVLWREVAILRQKHMKQQQIVNKLIHFLVSMVQTSRNSGIGIKRHYPLMLNDASHRPRRVAKLGSNLSELNTATSSMSPTGPVIHELDAADLLEECEPNVEEEAPAEGDFLPSEYCNVEVSSEEDRPSASNEVTATSPVDPTADGHGPETLLELAEECTMNPSLLLTTSPVDVSPSLVTRRLGKGKLRLRIDGAENRKRKSKKMVKRKGGSLSSVPAAVSTQESENGGSSEVENKESESLAAATDAAIKAIYSVSAASKKTPSKSILVPNAKGVGKTAVPIFNEPTQSCNAQVGSSDAVVFKQQPSTSADNMALACTGINNLDDSALNRCGGVPDNLDNHVDKIENELDTLRDILRGEGYTLDANTLLGLFSDESLSELPSAAFENMSDEQDRENAAGNELATYSSNLLDMVDMFEGSGTGEWSAPNTPDSSNIMDVSLSELNTPVMTSPGSVSKRK
ncbi:hypothetical protein C0J52_17781 [Blattella germanica]|nr:hypothetical protein C0J52_17781 [Blattella germanica]